MVDKIETYIGITFNARQLKDVSPLRLFNKVFGTSITNTDLKNNMERGLVYNGDLDWFGKMIPINEIKKQLDEFEATGSSHIEIDMDDYEYYFRKLRPETDKEFKDRLDSIGLHKYEQEEASKNIRLLNEFKDFLISSGRSDEYGNFFDTAKVW